MVVHLYYALDSSQRLQFPSKPCQSTSWKVQRLTFRRFASSRWLTPLDRSSRMYSRCCSVRLGRRPGKRPAVPAFAGLGTERSLPTQLLASSEAIHVDESVNKSP